MEGIDGTIKEIITGITVYVLTDKGLYAWGYNRYGQVGNGESGYEKDEDGKDVYNNPKKVLKPHKVEGIDGTIKEIITGSTVYVLTDTGLYAWGYNGKGQVGNGTTENVTTPYKAVAGNIKEFIIGKTFYVLTDKGLYAWGNNGYGQVGNGTTENVTTPYKAVAGNIKEFIISGSSNFATYYALTEDGALYAWGYNSYGQVGNSESGYEKDEDGNDDYDEPKKVLTPYEVQVKQN